MSSSLDPAGWDRTTVITEMLSRPKTRTPVGNVLDGRYRVQAVLGGFGSSGMGVVYVVRDGENVYAAKTFQHQFSQDLSLIERFMREARTWMLIGFHPHVVQAYFLEVIAAVPYLFLEYVEQDQQGRRSLADYLRQGRLPQLTTLKLAIQCCSGMAHATSTVPGLVHRDLKPDNMLITGEGALKITDFGLVHCRTSQESPVSKTGSPVADRLTQVGAVFGTPGYMAPEQFAESGAVTTAADIYAFGCSFYEAFSNRPVFTVERKSSGIERFLALRDAHIEHTPPPLAVNAPDCPVDLNDIIMKCLCKDPTERWSDFGELEEHLIRVFERMAGRRHRRVRAGSPARRQVASRERSLTLLEGYSRAIRLRSLRENQDNSPYAFHLALASYFYCQQEFDEERRQLEKARRVQAEQQGYEVVRRLADLALKLGDNDEAGRLLDEFLASHPDGLDHVLEPRIRLLIVRKDFDEAERILARLEDSFRATVLRIQLLRAAKRDAALAVTLRELIAERLSSVCSNIAALTSEGTVGWEYPGDKDILRAVLSLLAPGHNTTPLDEVTHVVWPDLRGFPDFSPEMAHLSQACGELARLEREVPDSERAVYAECARLLGYPDRLARHLERDEMWFWTPKGHEAGAGI